MSSEKAIFDIFKSLFDADTGSGGLQNTNSLNAARVVGPFTRRGDPQDTFALPRTERVRGSNPLASTYDTLASVFFAYKKCVIIGILSINIPI
jgi:hypothetical protein